jgi:shikimate kinase
MCSGKSTIAAAVARQLSCPLIDLDEVIAEQTGRTPQEIIDHDGEKIFRAIESEILTRVLGTPGSSVIALGGGAWISNHNRQLIEKALAITFWLDISFEQCWSRIKVSNDSRPLARNENQARELFGSRQPYYALAQYRIDANAKSVTEIAAEIIRSLPWQ